MGSHNQAEQTYSEEAPEKPKHLQGGHVDVIDVIDVKAWRTNSVGALLKEPSAPFAHFPTAFIKLD